MGWVELVIAIIGIIATIITYFIGKGSEDRKKKEAAQKREEEQELKNRDKTDELVKKTKEVNTSIDKQWESANDWDPDKDPH